MDKKILGIISEVTRKSAYGTARTALVMSARFLAFLMTLFILSALGLQIFVFWLNTEKGGDWLAQAINTGLQGTGYELEAERFSLSGIYGIKAAHFAFKYNDDMLVSAQAAAFEINPFPIGLKHLAITLKAQELNIENVPQNDTQAPESASQSELALPLSMPAIYFKTADIKINIRKLSVSEAVMDGGFETRIQYDQDFRFLADKIVTQGVLALAETQHPQAQFLPEKMINRAEFDLASQTLLIDELDIEKDSYKAVISGIYKLAENTFKAQMEAEWLKPEIFSPDLQGTIKIGAALEGTPESFSGSVSSKAQYRNIPLALDSQIERQDNIIHAKEIVAKGDALELAGALQYDLETALATGEIKTNIKDLAFIGSFIEQPDMGGTLRATAKLFAQNGAQAATLEADINAVKFQDITAQSLRTKVTANNIRDIESINADLTVLKAHTAGIDIENATLKASPVAQGKGLALALSATGHSYHPFSAEIKALLHQADPLNLDISAATLRTGGSAITAKGSITPAALNINAQGNNIIFAQTAFADLSAIPFKLARFALDITGTMEAPQIAASYTLAPDGSQPYDLRIEGKTNYAAGKVENTINGQGKGIKKLEAALSLPVQISLQPFVFNLAEEAPLTGRIVLQSDLKPLVEGFTSDGHVIKGQINAQAAIAGTTKLPLLTGDMRLQDGAFIDSYNDISFANIEASAVFREKEIIVQNISAQGADGKGSIKVTGKIDLSDFTKPYVDMDLAMRNMRMIRNKNYDASLSADIKFATDNNGYLVSGEITAEEASIRIPSQFDKTIPELNIVEAENQTPQKNLLEQIRLALTFKADNRIFVVGHGLDAEFRGTLDIRGDANTPQVEGNLETVRGRFEEFGRVFTIDQALMRFQGAVPPSPYMDIQTSTLVDDITAKVLISDSILNPKITLASVPALPEDEVLALILFGRSIENISPFQAIQLANTLRRLSGQGGGGFDPLQQLQAATGLDDLRVEDVGTENARVGAGKYISDDVYLQVEQGTAEGSGAVSVEIGVTSNITVESRTSQSGESDVGVFWEWNY